MKLLLLFASAFITVYLISFHTPIVVDLGVVIDRSWRIFNGEIPGRDFYCPTTPLTYYLQAGVFHVAQSVIAMKVYLAIQAGILVVLAFIYARKVLLIDKKICYWIVAPMTLAWLPMISLKQPWYDVDAVFFAFLALFCLGFKRPLLAGICCGLAFMCKQTIGAGAIVASIVFILIDDWESILFFVYGLLAVLIGFIFYFGYHSALFDVYHWMVERASQRYGEPLWKVILGSSMEMMFGPRNNFLKFLLAIYAIVLYFTWKTPVFKTVLFCFIAMWIGTLQEGGARYGTQQVWFGLVAGILLTIERSNSFKLTGKVLAVIIMVCFVWGFKPVWGTIGYKYSHIKHSLDLPYNDTIHDRLGGMYFRAKDYKIVRNLFWIENFYIFKDEKIFLFPDPLFFYFATQRRSPVPVTHFLVSGWELNQQEQNLIHTYLEDVDVVIIGKEKTFDTGFLRFDENLPWHEAMMSRSDYSLLRWWLEDKFPHKEEHKWFWVLRR